MKLADHRLNDFVREVASPSPAPGGGSVAAAAAAMGAGLVRMMGHLTVGKKKFLAFSPEIQEAFRTVTEKMDRISDCLLDLVDEDTQSFNRIMEAYALPKSSEAEISVRNDAIRNATIGAIQVPLETASLALDVLTHLDVVLEYGNRNCLSDLGVGTLMLYAGLEGALLNVETNLSGIDDSERIEEYRKKCDEFRETGKTAKDRILATVYARFRG